MIANKTLTVAELKMKLNEYPDDLPVFAQWESCNAYIDPESFEVAMVSKRRNNGIDTCECLVIDVNNY